MRVVIEPNLERMSSAEFLLWIAEQIDSHQRICEAPLGLTETGIAKCKVALDFTKNKALVFRALVEDWDYHRIIKELY